MRSFPKILAGSAVGAAVIGALVAGAFAQKKDDPKPKTKDKKETAKTNTPKPEKDQGGKDDKGRETGRMDIPVSKDHDAKGLKIPYFDGEGKKQMIFTIGVASRLDDEHIGMTETEVETFDENGAHEMTIELPKSELNVTTSVITTKKHVEIKRRDFTLTGETLEYNMKTQRGTLGCRVKMLIYNLDDEISEKPEPPQP